MKKKILILLVAVITFSNRLIADEKLSLFCNGDEFKLNPLTDSILLGSGISFAATDLFLNKVIKLNQKEFSNDMVFSIEDVNAFDRMFMNDYSKPLDYASTGLEALSVLTPLCLLGTSKNEWLTIGTMYAETIIFAYSFKELGKYL